LLISSAGIGRTGVFIALYYLLEAFERRQILNVKQLVDTIRLYRPHLVQTIVYRIFIL
jgi:protein tyrosine phosphatase